MIWSGAPSRLINERSVEKARVVTYVVERNQTDACR